MSDSSWQKGAATSVKTVLVTSAISLAYLVISYSLVGYKVDQLVLIAICNGCYYISATSRKFILGFSVFVIYWIIYDYMKAFPNYNYATVHIGDIYNFEKGLFGININGKILTPNEYWRYNGSTTLDIICGIFYLCWIPVPMLFAVYLFIKHRRQLILFWLTFVLVNFLGFIIYYTFPAAPPWYVQLHGFNFIANTPGNTAGLARFDAHFHISLFHSIYAKGSNVFAAMPSLHSAYPMVVLYYAVKNRLGWITAFFATVMVGIWFAAIYLSHHYVLDVLAGVATGLIGISLFEYIVEHSGRFKRSVDRFAAVIA
ncbi:PA-phosphatase [Mucilaginibacter sp. PPCGB 2223]|uniref:phosphatase PAP2 family protein n=1 Tax=Mucilaginibacter sp. PPCGB 2223 TaxID=1886027 RepID=UPI0008269133|nr:phosphatase PAP2 family protein [Mucilaginibacter sp. PPCGB 2223]OCX52815.1 PA-phosphatase [Mucilaginibacter sp. PPCGB 2223]